MTSPQQAFQVLMQELSASASTPINASTDTDPKPNVTLREAINTILWKESAAVNLANRPRDPKATDDQLGHVLSLRVEVLQILALLSAVAAKLGVDVSATLSAVTNGVQP